MIAAMSAIALALAGAAPPDDAQWQAAAQTLHTRFDAAENKPETAPTLADADSLIRAVFDLGAIRSLDPLDFPAIDARCEPVNAINRRYMFLGSGLGRGENPRSDQLIFANRNWPKFHGELSLGSAAALLCTTLSAHAIGAYMTRLSAEQRTEIRLRAARSGRQHLANAVTLQIGMQIEARRYTSDADRKLLLDTLAEAAPMIAESLTLAQRATVVAAIDQVLPGLSAPDRAVTSAVRALFASDTCVALCAIPEA